MRQKIQRASVVLASLVMLVIVLAASGCTIRFMADYDEQVDKSVTKLQESVETLFVKIESNIGKPEGSYDQLRPLYEEIRVGIGTLEVRVSAKTKNEKTIEQVGILRNSIDALEEIHKDGIQHKDVVSILRKQFKSAFVAILTLELAKKRGN
jgi:hypothetical protein